MSASATYNNSKQVRLATYSVLIPFFFLLGHLCLRRGLIC
jgi:hypothetical protein